MHVVLASQSKIKEQAVRQAFNNVSGFKLTTIKAPSGVNEQPIGHETMRGARNRIEFIKDAEPDADIYISIENGLFYEHIDYIDYAVVTVETKDGHIHTTKSEGVLFPKHYVLQTRDSAEGFRNKTVGETMKKAGIVKDNADPHSCLTDQKKSRVQLLNQAVCTATRKLKL